MSSEAKRRASKKYDKKHIAMRLAIKLNEKTDADIIKFLKTVGNKQGYVKQLIRDSIEAKKTQ